MLKNFEKFAKSSWGLEIRLGNEIIFRSKKSGVKGLLDFIKNYEKRSRNLVIFDKIVGRGAALLIAYLKAKKVYGIVGSKPGAKILRKHKIKFHFQETVANILNQDKTNICPMEKLSFGKTPEKFYYYLKERCDGNSGYRVPYR